MRLLRALGVLLTLVLGGPAHADFVLRAQESQPEQAPAANCAEVAGEEWVRTRIPAPVLGWSGEPLAVLVSGAGLDRVLIRQGSRAYCGRFGDGRQMDSRFRTGVGGVFVPPVGSQEPVEIATAGVPFALWPAVVVHGAPARVQQEDTLRFALRIAVLAVTVGIMVSTAFAWTVARDRALLLFSANTLAMALWIALLTGLSGFPFAWLPSGEWRARLLIALPALIAAGTVFLMLRVNRRRMARPHARAMAIACAVLTGMGLLGLLLARPQLGLLARYAEYGVVLLFLALVLSAIVLLLRRVKDALGNLLACLPILLVGGGSLIAPELLAPWKTEAYISAAAWIALSASAILLLRLGSLRAQRDQMRLLAETDALTGLANRRSALERLEQRVQSAAAGGEGFGLVFVDIDHFKQINDSFGHAAGDRVLTGVAQLLRQLVRASDTVARMGGEEFLLILPGADADITRRLAERIRERIEVLPLAGSGPEAPLSCTASVGALCSLDHPGVGADELLRRVDEAMYSAKRSGRNRVEQV